MSGADEGLIRVGHWNNSSNSYPEFPMPVATKAKPMLRKLITDRLTDVEEHAHERHYRGWSICRLCGVGVGSSDFKVQPNKKHKRDGYVWPIGFRHYIEEHGVMPPENFVMQVLGIGTHTLNALGYYDHVK